jgi:large subunit ribosomal protein L23
VRTINVKGKSKRMNTRRGLTRGFRRDWKKAIVTLRKGDTINFFGAAKAS